uniref:NAD-dependent epimerase/dehydratase n=1 Tax=Geobacter sp. (strain M21) TaxID=443144 RepID=C6E4X7_GEOSM
MRLLITGSTGFVGANLLHGLYAGHEAHVTVRQGADTWRIDSCLPDVAGVWRTDLADRDAVFDLMANVRPEAVIHVAAYGGLPAQTDKAKMVDGNLNATVNLLDAAVDNDVAIFINSGSSSEYGVKDQPMREDDNCQPVNFYGITKLAATNYCSMVGWATGRRICTLRLFSPYGQFEQPTRLYPSIMDALKRDESPRLSNPTSVRDFIAVERVVEVYRSMLSAPFDPGGVYNVGSGKQQTLREFVVSLSAGLGKEHLEPLWGVAQSRKTEPIRWEADTEKLRKLLGDF